MDERPVGVFDSGLGGLTAVKELISLLPGESIIYFGDTGRVPYGNRSKETILKYAKQDADFLKSQNVKMIVAACGTVSSTIPADFGNQFGVPFLDVVTPGAEAAVKATKNGRIGVIGTQATIRSGSYAKAIQELDEDAKVTARACPLFVPLVENGVIGKDNEIAKLTAKMYLEDLPQSGIDTLILGCTHYPLLADIIGEIMGPRITLIDPGAEAARCTAKILETNGISSKKNGPGAVKYFVSDTVDGFSEIAGRFLGRTIGGSVTRVDVS